MNVNDRSGLLNIVCLIVFGIQLYVDFSSYSNMVIGLQIIHIYLYLFLNFGEDGTLDYQNSLKNIFIFHQVEIELVYLDQL